MMPDIRASSGVIRRARLLATDSICLSCRRTIHLQYRQYAAAAAVATAESSESSEMPSTHSRSSQDSTNSPALRPAYQINAGIVLSRAPTLTRELTAFEKAFYLYQRRLNERQVLPFQRYFYYKKGTPAEIDWKRKIKERLTPARDIGVYNAYGEEAWNDEILVGDQTSEPARQVEELFKDAETAEVVGEEGMGELPITGNPRTDRAKGNQLVEDREAKKVEYERPKDRLTKADKSGDERSLDRLGWRTLYLLVKTSEGKWAFPKARLGVRENLYTAAERAIVGSGGKNMNTWVVGNAPVGHFAVDFVQPVVNAENGSMELGEKTFFLKGRIMAGQADLRGNEFGLSDFKWLAKEEVKTHVSNKYWSMVEDMLVHR